MTVDSREIVIRPFRPADQEAVKSLILRGLEERWGQLDPAKNADLNDIAVHYARATFLTAWQDGRLVGTGALTPRGEGVAEIVRMSVASEIRRQGVGRRILQALCQKAAEQGVKRIILETTETWEDAVAFYLNNGFRVTHRQEGDLYFALDLDGTAGGKG